jgi:catechol 2,3-dioxygenase-like lactoylglutathione lyase family enzyme
MIHHVSLPAKEPRRVAEILAEILGGRALAFRGPLGGAFTVLTGDEHGTMIEIYPEDTELVPKPGDNPIPFTSGGRAPAHYGWHVNLSVEMEPERIAAIGEREGWRVIFYAAAPPGKPAVFHVTQLWVENRVMVELMSPAQLAEYLGFMKGLAAAPAT